MNSFEDKLTTISFSILKRAIKVVISGMNKITTYLSIAALCYFCPFLLLAQSPQPTEIVVRAQAKDAKFIGTSMGGAKVIIRKAETGEILAQGLTEGSTGNTQAIMRQAKERYVRISEGAASFNTTLALTKPVFVTIEVLAPFNQKEARIVAQTQLWLIPGKHMNEEGIILEIPGFVVEAFSPQTHQGFSMEATESVTLKANIVMMCGCPLTSGGLWDADVLEVEAAVYINNKYKKSIPMKISDQANVFIGELSLEDAGAYQVVISAYHPISKNTGVDELNFNVN